MYQDSVKCICGYRKGCFSTPFAMGACLIAVVFGILALLGLTSLFVAQDAFAQPPGDGESSCHVANPPTCPSGKKLLCQLVPPSACKCVCVADSGPVPPIRYVTVDTKQTSAAIDFVTSGFAAGSHLRLTVGRSGSNSVLFEFNPLVTPTVNVFVGNLTPRSNYWFRISSGGKQLYEGSFSTLCVIGQQCESATFVCAQLGNNTSPNCYPCGGASGPCCLSGVSCTGQLGCQGNICAPCKPGTVAKNGQCIPCGNMGQPCCNQAPACTTASSATCQYGTCSPPNRRFGTRCQEAYENGWQEFRDYGYAQCSGFNSQLIKTDQMMYYYNLINAKPRIEDTSDSTTTEAVDLLWFGGHGGLCNDGSCAAYPMWNNQTHAFTTAMRLGDEDVGLSVLASHACSTLSNADGRGFERWSRVFAGGLRMVLGGWGSLYRGPTTDEVGEDFATYLQEGKSFQHAWHDGLEDWWVDNEAAAWATGRNHDDCWNRLSGLSWNNFRSNEKLRDGDIGWYCGLQFNDL
jgi:hypothetical protein